MYLREAPSGCRRGAFGLIWLALVCTSTSSSYGQRPGIWEPVGPSQATVFALELDPNTPSTVYAGTYFGGIYRSSDLGASWIPVPGPYTTQSVLSIGFDPHRPGIIYAGTFQHGIYVTRDDGVNWKQINLGLLDIDIQSIVVDPFQQDHVLIATGSRLHVSNDGGETWQQAQQDVRARVLLADPDSRGVVYAGTYNAGVWISKDSGATFNGLGEGLANAVVYSLTFDSVDKSLLAGTSLGAFRLAPNATKWEDLSYGQPPGSLTQVVRLPGSASNLLAVSGTGLYVSADDDTGKPYWFRIADTESRLALPIPGTGFVLLAGVHGEILGTFDGGRTLVNRSNGLQNSFVGSLAILDSGGTSTVLAGTDLGVYQWKDGDAHWKTSPGFRQTVFELQPDPQRAGSVYAGTELNGVFHSSDSGATWEATGDGVVPAEVYAIVQSPLDPFPLFAATSGGVYRSFDNGGHWTQISPLGNARALVLDSSNPPNFIVGADQGQFYVFEGVSSTPRQLTRGGMPQVDIVSVALAVDDKYYAVLKDGTVYAASIREGDWFRVADTVSDSFSWVTVDPAHANVVLLGTSGGGIYRSSDFGATWQPASEGLAASFVFEIAADPATENTFYAATEQGVFYSSDSGRTWGRAGEGLPSGLVLHLAVQGGRAGGLFASVLNHGVFRLASLSASWEPAAAGLPGDAAPVLGYNPAAGSVAYAGALRRGIFRTDDAGNSWASASRGMSLFVRGIAIDPNHAGILSAATLSAGIFRSTDFGASWQPSGLQDRTLYRLGYNHGASALYAATALGVSRSRDQGVTWEHLGQQTPYVFSLASHPGRPGVIYLGTFAGQVYRTTDGGQTWSSCGPGLPQADIVRLAVDGQTGTVYAAAKLYGIYKSVDDGATWQFTATIDGFTRDSAITSLCVDRNGAVLTAGSPVGAFRSLDGGSSWSASLDGLTSLEVTSLACGSASNPDLVAGTLAQGVFLSADRGASWTPTTPIGAGRISALAQDASNPSLIYAGTEAGLYLSRDAGKSWVKANGIPDAEVADIKLDARRVFVAVRGASVFRSEDQGATWNATPVASQGALFTSLALDDSGAYVGTQSDGVSKSTDGGATWTPPASPGTVKPITLTLATHPRDENTIYAGTAGLGVIKSTDGGTNWRAVNTGLNHLFVLTLATDPQEPETVFAGTNLGGVYISRDGGNSWQQYVAGMFHRNVTSLAIDPRNHKVIYAGCEGGGVFRMVLP